MQDIPFEPDRPAFAEREAFRMQYEALAEKLEAYENAGQQLYADFSSDQEISDLSVEAGIVSAFLSSCDNLRSDLSIRQAGVKQVSGMSAARIEELVALRRERFARSGAAGEPEIVFDEVNASIDIWAEIDRDLLACWQLMLDRLSEQHAAEELTRLAEQALADAYTAQAEAMLNS